MDTFPYGSRACTPALWVVSVLQIISLVGWIPFVSIAVVYGFGDHIQNPDEFGEVFPPLYALLLVLQFWKLQ